MDRREGRLAAAVTADATESTGNGDPELDLLGAASAELSFKNHQPSSG